MLGNEEKELSVWRNAEENFKLGVSRAMVPSGGGEEIIRLSEYLRSEGW